MPAQVTKNLLMKAMGEKAVKALDENKAKPPPEDNFGDLPAGIDGGVAQLKHIGIEEIKPGKTNAGKALFRATGVVRSPVEHKGLHVKGLNTTIMRTIVDVPNGATVDQVLAQCQDEVKKLWPDLDPSMLDIDHLGDTFDMLMKQKPHFKFRTWKGSDTKIEKAKDGTFQLMEVDEDGKVVGIFKNRAGKEVRGFKTEFDLKKAMPFAGRKSRVNHTWGGKVDWQDNEPVGGRVEDNGQPEATHEEPDQTGGEAAEEPEAQEEAGIDPAAMDADGALAELAATAGDASKGKVERKAAEDQLRAVANEAGISDERFDQANAYEDVVTMILEAKVHPQMEAQEEAKAESQPEPEPEPFKPAKGLVCLWTRMDKSGTPLKDARTKKPLSPVKVEILTWESKSNSGTVKDSTTGKPVVGADNKSIRVGIDALSPMI